MGDDGWLIILVSKRFWVFHHGVGMHNTHVLETSVQGKRNLPSQQPISQELNGVKRRKTTLYLKENKERNGGAVVWWTVVRASTDWVDA